MAVAIRLARGGSKKRPYYRLVVADSRNARDGRSGRCRGGGAEGIAGEQARAGVGDRGLEHGAVAAAAFDELTDERAELERLRKEVARLRMEAEFAKKVAAWVCPERSAIGV